MTRLFSISLLLTLFAAKSFAGACPDLTGRWLCTYSNTQPKQLITFSQTPVTGGMLYKMTTQSARVEEFLVDGVTRTKTSRDGWVQHETYSCIDGSSFGENSDLITGDGVTVFTRTSTVTLTDANTLDGDRKTVIPWSSGSAQGEELTFHCERK